MFGVINIEQVYAKTEQNLKIVGKLLNRPLTLAEKILFGHLSNPKAQEFNPGSALLSLQPDRIAMQDATAQMAILQFLTAGKNQTAVPTTVHCDHLIPAQCGAKKDLANAREMNKEVYDFLQSASAKCGIGFWQPGSGIIHSIVFENYAFPGGLMLGTDSHTPNAGGLGMIAIGVGGADAVDVMAGLSWEVLQPKIIGVKLTGKLKGWATPKDIILYLLGKLTVKGGTNKVIEYFGEGAKTLSCTGKSTITNMGAELGATTSIFPYDETMEKYLLATERKKAADAANKYKHLLTADEGAKYDQVIEIDLSTLEPHIVGPHSPDRARIVSKLAGDVKKNSWPSKVSAALIGSCTNSSYEDICRVADLAKQAAAKGLKMQIPFLVSPGSGQIYETIKRDGQLAALEKIGATILTNSCGPCIGQWFREDTEKGTPNSIITSFNRNFPARADGNPETLAFIASPEIVVALGLAGSLDFSQVALNPPAPAPDIPIKGFLADKSGLVEPPKDSSKVKIKVDPKSERLQLLKPFPKWDGKDFTKLPLLLKAKGKCTTDHISPAGKWLKFRGHLDNISNNMFTGAVNAFTGETGQEQGKPFPEIARQLKRWIVVGDENYGEGSSREHAAMSPRHLGAAAVIVRSFARIHETNLKKQGVLPLTFIDPADYDKVKAGDKISVMGLKGLAPRKSLKAILHHVNGAEDKLSLNHSLTKEQVKWFKAGSALNLIK
ncbi:MAG: aconitate hydratase [bacterium]